MISKTKLKKKIRRKTSPYKIRLTHFLKKQSPFWLKIAELISRPKRKFITVGLSRIDKIAKPNSTVVVPGKVLSDGELTKSIVIAAFSFSEKALEKLKKSKTVKLEELAKSNKTGDGIILIK